MCQNRYVNQQCPFNPTSCARQIKKDDVGNIRKIQSIAPNGQTNWMVLSIWPKLELCQPFVAVTKSLTKHGKQKQMLTPFVPLKFSLYKFAQSYSRLFLSDKLFFPKLFTNAEHLKWTSKYVCLITCKVEEQDKFPTELGRGHWQKKSNN